jgi:hypothetical protein
VGSRADETYEIGATTAGWLGLFARRFGQPTPPGVGTGASACSVRARGYVAVGVSEARNVGHDVYTVLLALALRARLCGYSGQLAHLITAAMAPWDNAVRPDVF